jgi:iron complex outermembrane receptor protein
MMGMNAGQLADAFNAADRKLNFGNLETVIKYSRQMTRDLAFNLDIGSKTRAPSYQELYLWLPLQATGGLADGRNYIGNLDLSPERSNEIAVGIDWTGERLTVSPQAYFPTTWTRRSTGSTWAGVIRSQSASVSKVVPVIREVAART